MESQALHELDKQRAILLGAMEDTAQISVRYSRGSEMSTGMDIFNETSHASLLKMTTELHLLNARIEKLRHKGKGWPHD